MTVDTKFWWYLSRACGITSWLLLTASLVWGVLLFTRALRRFDTPWWLLDMHVWLSGLAMITTALHLIALVADNYVHFSWAQLFVPGRSSWKTTPVALGTIAFCLVLLGQTRGYLGWTQIGRAHV